MRVPAAYLGLIAIWSTTPLAIKWSSEGVSFLFGSAARMCLGLICVLLVCRLRRLPLRRDRAALTAYAAAAVGIFPAMFCAYWGAQFIPSGWLAIVFGMSPMVTAVLASLLLPVHRITGLRVAAQLCGVAGLSVVFQSGIASGGQAVVSAPSTAYSRIADCRMRAGMGVRAGHGLQSLVDSAQGSRASMSATVGAAGNKANTRRR